MANEITFGFATGKTLTYGAYQPDGTVRTAAATALTEVAGTGYYKATDADITAGDIVIVREGTTEVGWGEYRPEVNTVLIEGDDVTETIIGTAGDTLEDLSGQMDVIDANLDQLIIDQNKVLNVVDETEEKPSLQITVE